jgi:hypothetical protein
MSLRHECYFGAIPEKFKTQLVELYKTPYCTTEYIKSFCGVRQLNCFSIHDELNLIHLILFTIDQQQQSVSILNRVFEFDIKYLNIFSNYIFNAKLHINKIQVNHLTKPILNENYFPFICRPFDEDYIIKLPVSDCEYLTRLSPNMRRHTKNYISKIERAFGSYSFSVFEKKDVTEDLINKIIEMNHLRMNAKNIVSGIDRIYAEKIMEFVGYFGFISILELKGEIVAGLISYSIKNNYFVEELSSDPFYDSYNVGHTCLYLTIQECIKKSGNEFHLLWGNNPYKKRFLAERYQLYSVTTFRTIFIKFKCVLVLEIFPCLSSKYILKLCKRKVKIILGQRVLGIFKNLELRKKNNKIVD